MVEVVHGPFLILSRKQKTQPSSRGLLGAQSDSLPETKVEGQAGLWLLGGSEVKTVGLGTALYEDSQGWHVH